MLFALLAVGGIGLLMLGLSWASSLTGAASGNANAIDAASKTITAFLREEPPQLDSSRATDQVSGMVLGHIIEGLLRYDEHNQLAPGVAERWEITDSGATFWLRKDARWSDGKPVTAHDFVFAWRLVVDPKNASEYSYILFPVKNGEAINNGKLPLDALGVVAEDNHTLVVTFEQPLAYFDKLVAFGTYAPIREDFYRSTNGAYGADADKLLYVIGADSGTAAKSIAIGVATAPAVAGGQIEVLLRGIATVKVDGSATAIAAGDALVLSGVKLVKAVAGEGIVAQSLVAVTTDTTAKVFVLPGF